jgi:hypothetical protein
MGARISAVPKTPQAFEPLSTSISTHEIQFRVIPNNCFQYEAVF